MKSILALALLATAAVAMPLTADTSKMDKKSLFSNWQKHWSKTYATVEEEAKRLAIFIENIELVLHNQRTDPSAEHGLTQFMDVTPAEFKATHMGFAMPNPDEVHEDYIAPDIDASNIPDSYDWSDHGAVTPVKNQGSCGSCWAFSTTGNIEGQWFLANNSLPSLSEQQFVDCDKKQDQGCNGGLPSNAYQYAIANGGVDTESSYPYEGVDDSCRFEKSNVGATISNWTKISTDEDQIAAQLVARGPLSIGIDAAWMQTYMGGVSCPLVCSKTALDHGVLITGYGKKAFSPLRLSSQPYWIVKNSWGPSWGDSGFYHVCKGKGMCGLNKMVTSAIV